MQGVWGRGVMRGGSAGVVCLLLTDSLAAIARGRITAQMGAPQMGCVGRPFVPSKLGSVLLCGTIAVCNAER